MLNFTCKHCWREIVPCQNPNLEHVKWQDADETMNGLTRWSCLDAPQAFAYNPTGNGVIRGRRTTPGTILIGLHEPNKRAVAASLDEVLTRSTPASPAEKS